MCSLRGRAQHWDSPWISHSAVRGIFRSYLHCPVPQAPPCKHIPLRDSGRIWIPSAVKHSFCSTKGSRWESLWVFLSPVDMWHLTQNKHMAMPSPAPLTPPLAREPSLEDLLLAQAGAACQGSELKQIQIKYRLKTVNLQCHILQDGDTFWERGGMGQFLGQRYWKKDYLLSSNWKEIKKPFDITKIMGIILHLLHQLQYWPGSAISYKDSAYILQLEFWFIAWLFHAWTIAIMFVPSSFFFFLSTHYKTIQSFRACFVSHWSILAVHILFSSLLFSYMCSVTY